MEHAASGSLLPVAEIVHWVALAFMAFVYTARLAWMFKFTAGRDRQMPGEKFGNTTFSPRFYSLLNVTMPNGMESTRTNIPFYVSFVVFHIGALTGIFFAIISSAYPPFVQVPAIAYLLMLLLGVTFLVSVYRVVRRFTSPVLRLVSSPDDYFAILTLMVWLGFSVPAVAQASGLMGGEGIYTIFLFITSFFLIYVPFSKISHYMYYPFTRYFIGKTLGHRGSMPPAKVQG